MKFFANLGLSICMLIWSPIFILGNGVYTGAVIAGRTAKECGSTFRWIWTR